MQKKSFLSTLYKPAILIPIIAIILIFSFSIGFLLGRSADTTVSDTSLSETRPAISQQLSLNVVHDEESGIREVLPGLTYDDFSEVTIRINNSSVMLEDAIQNGLISPEEIFAYARIDSKNQYCTETYLSQNGLTQFNYQYPEFDLRITYDVYETPDKKQHLISKIMIVQPNAEISSQYYDDTTGERIDLEDWGLNFHVSSTTPNGLTLLCDQSGGQQIGELFLDYYELYCPDTNKYIPLAPGVTYLGEKQEDLFINNEEESLLSIDWTESFGTLDKGSYYIYLYIQDLYDEADIHPLMINFQDKQCYRIDFTIE